MTTEEKYGTSAINIVHDIKYGKKWWQFWKNYEVKFMSVLDMEKEINDYAKNSLLQYYPDSQIIPFGPNQIAWVDKKYGEAFHRKAEPLVCKCNHGEKR